MKRVPIVVFGRDYWQRVVNFDLLLQEGMIAPKDIEELRYADDAEEAWSMLVAAGLTIPPPRAAEPRPDVAP